MRCGQPGRIAFPSSRPSLESTTCCGRSSRTATHPPTPSPLCPTYACVTCDDPSDWGGIQALSDALLSGNSCYCGATLTAVLLWGTILLPPLWIHMKGSAVESTLCSSLLLCCGRHMTGASSLAQLAPGLPACMVLTLYHIYIDGADIASSIVLYYCMQVRPVPAAVQFDLL